MTKRLLIDARQPEETRVVLLSGTRIEDFDYEAENRKQLKGNLYLARVTRVEPSLQAAFVEYGGNRQGFLAFSEIHPDYYRIPVEDREALIEADLAANSDDDGDGDADGTPETVGGDGSDDEDIRPRRNVRKYKIQEVISRKQIMLVQVVKEERGNKGAALTTYLSLAGRYCVLMPNSSRGGGVSRKITNAPDRKRLKTVVGGLDVAKGMAVIVRTAGAKRTKTEIARDYAYLSKLWDDIRSRTLESQAPTVIHEEGNLIKRSIRDLYTSEVEEILVEGEDAYKSARSQMKMLIPSHLKKVQNYEGDQPLFQRFGVESQMDTIHSPQVTLKSGGYLVINQTEALVAVDVNSGRSTRERNIEETALKTNLEAADELARQLRLRDLSGLIVVDFIDMEENRNQNAVERRMKEAMRNDRARIQIGSISHFGLLEMSRQRLRISLNESISNLCPHCEGTGRVRSIETAAMQMLRVIEDEAQKGKMDELHITVHREIALFILNHKRQSLAEIEARCNLRIILLSDDSLIAPDFAVERLGWQGNKPQPANNNRRTRPEPNTAKEPEPKGTDSDEANDSDSNNAATGEEDTPSDEDQPKRRKRGRRGGRRRRRRNGENAENNPDNNPDNSSDNNSDANEAPSNDITATPAGDNDEATVTEVGAAEGDAPKKSSRGGRGRRGRGKAEQAVQDDVADTGSSDNSSDDSSASEKPKRARKKAAPKSASPATEQSDPSSVDAGDAGDAAEKPKRARKKAAASTSDEKADLKKADSKKADEEQTTKKKPAAKKATAKKATAKKAAKKAPAGKTSDVKPEGGTVREAASSTPQDVIEVGETKPESRKRGWWNRG